MTVLALMKRMDKLEADHALLMQHLADHNELGLQISEDLKDVADIIRGGKIGLAFLGKLAVVAKWVSTIGAAVAVVWGLIWTARHGGKPPEFP